MRNVWLHFFGKLLAGSLAAALLQSCSLEARRSPVTLRLDLSSIRRALEASEHKSAPAASQAMAAPGSFSDLTCVAVNVASDLIPVRSMPQNLRYRANIQPQRFSTVQSFVELTAVTLAQPTIETQLVVPNNIGLTVQLWGIKTELGGCPGTPGREVGQVAVYALGQKYFSPLDLSTVVDFSISNSASADLLTDANRVFDEIRVGINVPQSPPTATSLSAFPISGSCTESGQSVLLRIEGTAGGAPIGLPVCNAGMWSTSVNLASLPAGTVVLTADHGDGADKKANTARISLTLPGITLGGGQSGPTGGAGVPSI